MLGRQYRCQQKRACPIVGFSQQSCICPAKGQQRIWAHALCFLVVSVLNEVFFRADVQATSGLFAAMSVDGSIAASLMEAGSIPVSSLVDTHWAPFPSFLNNQRPKVMAPFSLSLPFLCWFSLNRSRSRLGQIEVYMNVLLLCVK